MALSKKTRQALANRRRAKQARTRTRMLVVEPLEDRRMLATITVTSTDDLIMNDGQCTLREAVVNSNANSALYATSGECAAGSGDDTIKLPAGVYSLSLAGTLEDGALTGDLDLTDIDGVTITGAGIGVTVINGMGIDRVFDVDFLVPATFARLTITGGVATDDTFSVGDAQGGGIFNFGGTLTISDVLITRNKAQGGPSSAGQGGGIFDFLGNTTIIDSTIRGNAAIGGANGGAGEGGGIFTNTTTVARLADTTIRDNMAIGGAAVAAFDSTGDAAGGGVYSTGATWNEVVRNTISDNSATGGTARARTGAPGGMALGGGVFSDDTWEFVENTTVSSNRASGGAGNGQPGGDAQGGGWYADGTTDLSFVTIAFNVAMGGRGGTGEAGGVFASFFASVSPDSVIIANNKASTSSPDVFGDFLSQDYNLIGDGTGSTGFTGTNDQVGTSGTPIDPILGPLANNGGSTETHALLLGSPAVNKGNPNTFPDTDQRGVFRPDGILGSMGDPDVGAYEQVLPRVALDKFTRIDINPIDIQKLVRVESPGVQGDVCDVLGKPVAMTFQYLPGTTVFTAQAPDKAKILFDSGAIDDDGVSFVVVTDQSSASNALNGGGKQFFRGDVAFDDLFEATEATADFGSTTYIHFFGSSAGGLLQSLTYHTSCSQPIQLGDVIGNAKLAGYVGEMGSADVVDLGPGLGDSDADLPTGPEAMLGDTVVFTYVVSNPIAGTEISSIQVSDEVLAPVAEPPFAPAAVLNGGFNVGDIDQDSRLDSGERWLYTSHVTITAATPTGQHIDKATVAGNGGTVFDLDPAHFTVAAVPPVAGDLCDALGKPVALTFNYIPGTTVSTAQDSGKAKVLFDSGSMDDDGVSFVVVTDQSSASNALSGGGKQFFRGNVAFNGLFEATEATADFGSTTFIHFFDDSTGGLLQSITYHTSCSQPIQLGDVIGNSTLTAYVGEEGSAALPPPPVAPPPVDLGSGILFLTDNPFSTAYIGDDADDPTGPIAQRGDKVTYTYEVSNPGAIPVTIDDLIDDNDTPGDPSDDFTPVPVLVGGFNVGDGNQNNLLDPGEFWYFQVMEIATDPGQHTNTATVTVTDATGFTAYQATDSDASNHIVNPLAIEKYVFVAPQPQAGDVCETLGKPVALTFQYVPGTTVSTAQDSGKATILFNSGSVDDDGVSFVVVTDQSSTSNALSGGGKQFFRGNVAFDGLFEATKATDSFGSATFIHFFDDSAGGLLQSITYHTSCSQPIQLGDVVGNATLTGYAGESGSASLPVAGLGDPADTPAGPVVLQGDEVVFNFKVTNLGNVDLTNVQVTDSALGPVTDFVDMGDGDLLLEPGESWILTISTIASIPGQQMNLGTVTANSVQAPGGDPLSQIDPAYYFVESIKFFVPDDEDDAAYRYTESVRGVDSFSLEEKNSSPRGATSLADGSRLWILDKNRDKNVYVYDGDGAPLGVWQARKTPAENDRLPDKVEGIATDGTSIWIVEADKHRVYFYNGAASQLSGSRNATSKFSLHSSNDHAKGLTTDGVYLWVVDDDGSKNRVFKYTVAGMFKGYWDIDPANDKPRGITIDPNGGTSIWIVDQDTDQVFQYDGATGLTSGSKTADFVYDLGSENGKPEGIADPRPLLRSSPTNVESLPPFPVSSLIDSRDGALRTQDTAILDQLFSDGPLSGVFRPAVTSSRDRAEFATANRHTHGAKFQDHRWLQPSAETNAETSAPTRRERLDEYLAIEDATESDLDAVFADLGTARWDFT